MEFILLIYSSVLLDKTDTYISFLWFLGLFPSAILQIRLKS